MVSTRKLRPYIEPLHDPHSYSFYTLTVLHHNNLYFINPPWGNSGQAAPFRCNGFSGVFRDTMDIMSSNYELKVTRTCPRNSAEMYKIAVATSDFTDKDFLYKTSFQV